MSATALKQNIPGATIHLDTPLGSVVPITYAPDGTIEGKAGAVAFYLGSEKDRGRWWIEGNAICHQWNIWFDGKKKCLTVALKSGSRVDWADQDGGTGTATVIAFGKAEQEAPKQVAALLPSPTMAPLAPSTPAQPTAKLGGDPSEPRQAPPLPKAAAKSSAATALAPKSEQAKREPPKTSPGAAVDPSAASASTVTPRLSSANAMTMQPSFRVINVAADDMLNVRRSPDPRSDVIATIEPGSGNVRVTGLCNGDWCPVQSGNNNGWVHRYFIAPSGAIQPQTQRAPQNPITYRVVGVPSSDVLNIRRIADGDSEIVATIPPSGTRIRLTGYCRREWCPVSYGRSNGWVNRQYLTLEY